MPGFKVSEFDNEGGLNAQTKFYYSYTWTVPELFGTSTSNRDALIALKDASLPSITINKEIALGASLEYKYAKGVTWDDIRVTFYDSVGLIDILREWRSRIWSPESGIRVASSYKRDTRLSQHTPDMLPEDTITWRLYNSWPSNIKYGDLTYTNSDVKYVDLQITYDWAEEQIRRENLDRSSIIAR